MNSGSHLKGNESSVRPQKAHDRVDRETWRMFLMPAYLIAEHIITNQTKFEEYRTKAAAMIAKHGGRYLTKGGSHKCTSDLDMLFTLEGV